MSSLYVPVTQQTISVTLNDMLKRSAISARATEALIAVLQERAGRRRIAVVGRYSENAARSARRGISFSARQAARSAIELTTPVLFTTRQHSEKQVIMAAPMLTSEDRAWGALVTVGESARFSHSAASALEQAARWIASLLPTGWKAYSFANDSPCELRNLADMPADIAAEALIHELRAPLSAVGFVLETLRYQTSRDDAQFERLMAVANMGIAEAQNVVRWFRQLRLAQVPPDISRPIPVEEGISKAMTLLTGNPLQLSVLIPGDLPPVIADFTSLTHIFTNLLDNAIRHTCPPHQVTIQGWYQRAGVVEIAVTSSGSGISYEQQRTIFLPYGGDPQAGRRHEHGMGLAIAQYLAVRMGGYIRVESDGETFTTFTLTLPAGESDTDSQTQEEW